MDRLFKSMAQKIKLYLGKEVETDPFEKNTDVSMLNSLPISAIVTDLTATKIQYAMIGITTDSAKEVVVEKKYLNLLKLSQMIEIEGEYYEGWRQNGKLQIRKEGNFLRLYVYVKKV